MNEAILICFLDFTFIGFENYIVSLGQNQSEAFLDSLFKNYHSSNRCFEI